MTDAMTQLEEYRERREFLLARIQECRRIAYDADTSREEKRTSARRWRQYQELLNELEIQLQAFDPNYSAVKHGQRDAVSVFSMNQKSRVTEREVGEYLGVHTGIDGDVIPYDAEDPDRLADLSAQQKEQRDALLFVAQHLAPRQAEVLDLKYNQGYSLKKVAEVMGINKQSAWDTLNRARQVMQLWIELTTAVKDCTFSETVFAFDEFLERIPDAFPLKCKELLLTLYDAPASQFQTRGDLQAALNISGTVVGRRLRTLKTLCDAYGIPETATHTLIRRSKGGAYDVGTALHRISVYRTSFDYGVNVRHDDSVLNFQARNQKYRFSSVEDAVRGWSVKTFNLPEDTDLSAGIAAGLALFDEKRLCVARGRLDGGKELKHCGKAESAAADIVRDVIETAAQYAAFRYDTERVVKNGGDLRVLLDRWRFLPPRSDEALLILLEDPEMTRATRLMEKIGTSSVSNTGKLLRRIGELSGWWGIPAEWLPPLVLRYMPEDTSRKPSANDFKRAVALRRDAHTGGNGRAGT